LPRAKSSYGYVNKDLELEAKDVNFKAKAKDLTAKAKAKAKAKDLRCQDQFCHWSFYIVSLMFMN